MLGDLLLTKRFSFLFLCSCSCSCNHYINFRILHLHTNFNARRKLRNLRKIENLSKIEKIEKSTSRIEKSKNRVESKNRRIEQMSIESMYVHSHVRSSIVDHRSMSTCRDDRDDRENMARLHLRNSLSGLMLKPDPSAPMEFPIRPDVVFVLSIVCACSCSHYIDCSFRPVCIDVALRACAHFDPSALTSPERACA